MLARADIATSEKMRKVLEAYQTENTYGRTLGAYATETDLNGQTTSLSVLRIGRVALLAETLDRKDVLRWDVSSRSWKPLDKRFLPEVERGLKMARKQMAPELLRIPLVKTEVSR